MPCKTPQTEGSDETAHTRSSPMPSSIPNQAPTVPQKNLLCCSMLWHAVACFKPLVGVT